MFEAAINEFPFVAELPKREKSKLADLWDRFQEVKAITDKKGMIVPPIVAAELLGVSRQRIWQLMEGGRLARLEWRGQVFVTERDLMEFAESERKTGRPCGPNSLKDVCGMTIRAVQAFKRASKKSSK